MKQKNIQELLLKQSLAIRTPVLPEVKKVIKNINPDLDSVNEYKTNIKKWLEPVIDLKEFYVYPMNGITEGLNWWAGKNSYNIKKAQGDYQWIQDSCNDKQPIWYHSTPSAIDGNYRIFTKNETYALDLAYIGSTPISKINIDQNCRYAFFSLSKSFGVRNIRTGWYFCREQDERLDNLVYNAKYYNYYANQVAEKIISNFDIDYVHTKLSKEQDKFCSVLNLNKSHSVWLATSTDDIYSKFRRNKNIARLNLSGLYTLC